MSVKVKLVHEYLKLLNKRLLGATTMVKRGIRSKNRVVNFFLKNNRWPNRRSKDKKERSLGTVMENYISKESGSYDPEFRKLAFSTGRTTNNKRKHSVKKFKEEILAFIKEYGRVPSTSYKFQTIEGEARLRSKLDYYTQEANDMAFLGKIYDLDPCHKTGIPVKFRKVINEALDVDRPLIRLVR